MKKLLLLPLLALGLSTAAPITEAADISINLGGDRYRDHDRIERYSERHDGRRVMMRDESARLVRTTRRTVVQPDGDRVVITRRVYEQPDGDRFERETRRVVDRW